MVLYELHSLRFLTIYHLAIVAGIIGRTAPPIQEAPHPLPACLRCFGLRTPTAFRLKPQGRLTPVAYINVGVISCSVGGLPAT